MTVAVDALIPGAPMLFMGEGFRVHATSRETAGGFLIAEIASRPGGGPRHMHAHEAAEQYMCLEGAITVHTYRNLSDAPARLLCTLSPPHDMEAFLLEVCDPHAEGAPLPAVDPAVADWAMQVAGRHGMQILDEYDPAVLA